MGLKELLSFLTLYLKRSSALRYMKSKLLIKLNTLFFQKSALWVLLIALSSYQMKAQDSQTFFVDAAFQRFNMREFDLRATESNLKERMLCDNWCESTVITEVDTVDIKFNIDLSESIFYVNIKNRVLSIRNDFVKSFIIDDKVYINYLLPESSKTMILETMVTGDFSLYRHHDLEYHPPNFNAILNVGSKEGFYKKRYDLYAFCEDKLIRIPAKAKKALKKLKEECDVPSSVNAKGDIIELFNSLNGQ